MTAQAPITMTVAEAEEFIAKLKRAQMLTRPLCDSNSH
jgi:hypothetical protein